MNGVVIRFYDDVITLICVPLSLQETQIQREREREREMEIGVEANRLHSTVGFHTPQSTNK